MYILAANLLEDEEVQISWKEDEGQGWYSNKRQKKGIVGRDHIGFYVMTESNPRVRLSEMTALKRLATQPSETPPLTDKGDQTLLDS